MSEFYTESCQAKELYEEAKTAKEKDKELNTEVLLKTREVIRLTEDLSHLQGIETKLKNEVEELKADTIEKETRIAHLEGKVSKFTLSLEKAREEAVVAFKKSDEYKNRLDSHYAAGYEDFRTDAKEAFPDLDFDTFQIPLATESSLLVTSFEDVNVVNDTNNEVTRDDSKSRSNAPNGLSKWIYFLLRKFILVLLEMLIVLGFISFWIYLRTILSSKFLDELYTQSLSLSLSYF